MAIPNLKRIFAGKDLKVGHSIFEFSSPGLGQIIAGAGVDFVFLDMEHSGFGITETKGIIAGLRAGNVPALERWGLSFWAFFARRPWLYGPAARLAVRGLRYLGRRRGRLSKLWFAGGWTDGRDLPAPEGQTFQERWRRQQRQRQGGGAAQ